MPWEERCWNEQGKIDIVQDCHNLISSLKTVCLLNLRNSPEKLAAFLVKAEYHALKQLSNTGKSLASIFSNLKLRCSSIVWAIVSISRVANIVDLRSMLIKIPEKDNEKEMLTKLFTDFKRSLISEIPRDLQFVDVSRLHCLVTICQSLMSIVFNLLPAVVEVQNLPRSSDMNHEAGKQAYLKALSEIRILYNEARCLTIKNQTMSQKKPI